MKIAGLYKNDIVDGEGFVVSCWMQGCPIMCKGCHNPQTWDPNGGTEIEIEQLINEILEAIPANGIMRNFSVLGGEPLATYNVISTYEIIKAVREHFPNIKIFLWTGYLYENVKEIPFVNRIFPLIDVLIDGPFKLEERDITLRYRGSINQRVIDMQKTIETGEVRLWL